MNGAQSLIRTLAAEDIPQALAALAEAVDAPLARAAVAELERPALPTGPLTLEAVWRALAHGNLP